MSVEVMTWVWKHSSAEGTDRLVLLAIADSADDDGTNAWPSEVTLADKCRVSERTVRRSIRALESLGVLVVEPHAGGKPETRRDRRPNRYTVRMATGQIDRPDMVREDTGGKNGRTSATVRADTVVRRTVLDPSIDPSFVALERTRRDHPEVDVDYEVANFRDYHAGKGSKMANWDAAWRTWARRAAQWKGSGPRPRDSVTTRNVRALGGKL